LLARFIFALNDVEKNERTAAIFFAPSSAQKPAENLLPDFHPVAVA
jgi:hypothetical protein